jgi:hypothetical protein
LSVGEIVCPPIERVGPLAGFGLDELADNRNPLDLREATDGRSLRLDPEPGAVLLLRGDSQIGDRLPHTNVANYMDGAVTSYTGTTLTMLTQGFTAYHRLPFV